MAKKHRKNNKRARAATLVGLIAAVIIAVVLYSQEIKLRAIYAEQTELEEVIAGQQEEMDRLERHNGLINTMSCLVLNMVYDK